MEKDKKFDKEWRQRGLKLKKVKNRGLSKEQDSKPGRQTDRERQTERERDSWREREI